MVKDGYSGGRCPWLYTLVQDLFSVLDGCRLFYYGSRRTASYDPSMFPVYFNSISGPHFVALPCERTRCWRSVDEPQWQRGVCKGRSKRKETTLSSLL